MPRTNQRVKSQTSDGIGLVSKPATIVGEAKAEANRSPLVVDGNVLSIGRECDQGRGESRRRCDRTEAQLNGSYFVKIDFGINA